MEPEQQPSRPTSNQDWADRKAVIMELYESKPLKDVMKIMEEQYLFKATENQYKKRISAWGPNPKRINEDVYLSIISKKRKRGREGKDSAFRLGEIDVENSKIARFQKRKNIGDDDELPDAPSPPGLLCLTPPAILRSITHSPDTYSPGLSSFDWFSTFGDFINRSAAGTPVIQTDSVSGLLRCFVTVVDNYEMNHQYTMMIRDLKPSHDCINCRIRMVLDYVEDQNMAQGLLETAINELIPELEARQPSLLSPAKTDSVSFIVGVCKLYAPMGRANAAIGVLEALDSLIESSMKTLSETKSYVDDIGDYTPAHEWYELERNHRECLLAQALCFAIEGYYEEATIKINRSLGLSQHSDCIHFLASLENTCDDCVRSKLRNAVCDSFSPEVDIEHREIWSRAIRAANILLSLRVNIDRETQPCHHSIGYDPVLTEEAEWDES